MWNQKSELYYASPLEKTCEILYLKEMLECNIIIHY